MKKRDWFKLILILTLGILVRFWKLGETPKGFYLDEAALGYNALSIMETGKDEYGMSYPILFRSFGDFKAPIYTYLLIPIYKILGVSVWSTRVLSAITGGLIIWIGFWIVKNLSKNINLALIVGLFLAISPWQIIFSRTSYETNVSLLFLMLMIWSFYKSRQNKKWLLVTAITGGLSFLTYHSERVIVPLLLGGLIIKYKNEIFTQKNRKILVISILAGLILILPTVKLMTTPGFLSRLNSLSILSNKVKKPWGFNQDLEGGKKVFFNNLLILKSREFLSLYVSYFSPRYLFELGDPGPRSSYPDLGPFWWWQLPFWIVGVGWLFKKTNKNEKELKFLVILMLTISPIPASITRDPFSSIRALPLAFPLIILAAVGLNAFLKKSKVLSLLFLILAITWSLGKSYLSIFKFNDYFRGYAWEEGVEEMVGKIKNESLPIVVDNARGEIYSQILFFTQADPKNYQEINFEVNRDDYYTNMDRNEIKQINNITVKPIKWEEDIYKEKILVGDAMSISEEQINEHCLTVVFEVKDKEEKIIFRGVKTHPKDKYNFYIGDKINGKIMRKCQITSP